MTMEADLVSALGALVDGRVFPDIAPDQSPLPRIVYQQVGGRSISYLSGETPDMENARMQISVWAASRAEAKTLIKACEAALGATQLFAAEPLGMSVSVHEPDTGLYGSHQDFSIWSAR